MLRKRSLMQGGNTVLPVRNIAGQTGMHCLIPTLLGSWILVIMSLSSQWMVRRHTVSRTK